MNNLQEKFFDYLADIQETCVQSCMTQHNMNDDNIESMLYEVTYDVITDIMVMIDGYSGFSSDKHDIVNTVTGEHLKENPNIELHDQTEGYLKTE